MPHYIYRDYRLGAILGQVQVPISQRWFTQRAGEIIFEIDASDILEADKLLLNATGHVASKTLEIGCTVEN